MTEVSSLCADEDVSAGEVTRDTLLRGRVHLVQPARGFRSSLDPLLLAGFVRPPYGRFLDVGCGTGAIAFLLLARDAEASGFGVEVQPRLARLAERGLAANRYETRLRILTADVRAHASVLEGKFDLIATNPPFRPLGRGLLPPDEERQIAHHEVRLTLAGWLDVAAEKLSSDGRLAAVYPADRLAEVRDGLRARGLRISRLRLVKPQWNEPARRMLFEAVRGRGGMTIEPPLVVHGDNGYSAEVRRLVGEA
jgi:tRNA1Val (adenine37-N6)-methyltransferase